MCNLCPLRPGDISETNDPQRRTGQDHRDPAIVQQACMIMHARLKPEILAAMGAAGQADLAESQTLVSFVVRGCS